MNDHAELGLSGKKLAAIYGVSEATVSRVIRTLAQGGQTSKVLGKDYSLGLPAAESKSPTRRI